MPERSPAARIPSPAVSRSAGSSPRAEPSRRSRARRPERRRLAALVALAALVSLGCMGKVLPQSAQAGATVAIPLDGMSVVAPIGFGGTGIDDPQRGELLYSLDTPDGPVELTTRGTVALGPHAGSSIARSGLLRVYQIVSLVDIPSDAPLGTHPVDVVWRHPDPATGEILETEKDYEGELSVLPASIEVTGPSGTETITGEPTPFERSRCSSADSCDWEPVSASSLRGAVPDPSLRIQLDTKVWAVELDVSYPAAVIDVVDVYETPQSSINRRATTWFDDDGSGSLTLSASATQSDFNNVSVAFGLDDPTASILDPADVSVSVVRAWDQDGNEIAVAASVGGIF